jgi:hypothetical protein
MATSGTSTFEMARDDLLAEALEALGAIGPGETRTANNSTLFDSAARALNRVVKAIDANGQRLWRVVRRSTTTVAATATFTTASDVLDLDEPVRYTRSGQTTATPVTALARDEYMRLPDRTTPGVPRNYYVEKTLTTTTVYLWPVPDATGDTIEYACSLKGQDFNSGADTPDFTSKWGTCLLYGLIVEMAPKLRQPAAIQMFKPLFEAELNRVNQDDSERAPMQFAPFGGTYYGGGAG